MTTPEEQELMAQIGDLASRINRHKAKGNENQPPNHAARGSYRTAPYPRAGYRGRGRGGYAPTYRNKTLVLNGQPGTSVGDPKSNGSSWVTRNDRHMQLINSNVFEKDSQTRTQAIEQTQRQQQMQRDHSEKSRIMSHVNRVAPASSTSNPSAAPSYEIVVDGIRFHVTKQGSKLIRAPDSSATTPKVAMVGGVKFHRTKNGNLVRHGIAKAQQSVPSHPYWLAGGMTGRVIDRYRRAGGIKKVDVPCTAFSWTGSCPKGPQCRFLHDPSKVAICRDWLLKDDCQHGKACDLAHESTEERTPLCMHFAKGKCNNDSCPYVHAEHSLADPVCRDFGKYGYCSKGAKCPERHVFECPDFSNSGVCKTPGCKLLHRERASVLRRAGAGALGAEAEDVSSDEDNAGGSDDIDSDEVEEFIGNEGDNMDFLQQKDYIGF